jgi:TRAP-type C4-dicarboxylate transport system permease small subunit
MGKIICFFGWLMIAIIVTLLIFGHIMMVMIYSTEFLMDTLFPKDPKVYSSIWMILAMFVPGCLFLLIGTIMNKWENRKKSSADQADSDADEASKTPQTES